jgi:hypothetical protein
MNQNEIPHDRRYLGVPSGASKNNFRAYGMFGANRALILLKLALSPNEPKRSST